MADSIASAHVKSSRGRLLKILPILVCMISFIVTARVVGTILWSMGLETFDLWAKISPAVADPRVDLLFLGSSHIELGVDPIVFDKTMRENGRASHSYNIAAPGESIVEIRSALVQFFKLHPCCLRYVVVEPDFAAFGSIHVPTSIRAISFFNFGNAARFIYYYENITFQSGPVLSREQYVAKILEATALHYTNTGLAEFLMNPTSHDESDKLYDLDPKLRGFHPFDQALSQEFARDDGARARYQAALSYMNSISGAAADSTLVSDYQIYLVSAIASLVHQQGAQLILVRAPQVLYWNISEAFITKLRSSCTALPPFLDFGYPKLNPALFDEANRSDDDHLNRRGAALFSSALATEISADIEQGQLSPTAPRMSCTEH